MQHVTDWIKKLNKIFEVYEAKNIYRVDKTGLFQWILPSKLYASKEKSAVVVKAPRNISLYYYVVMEREIEQPFVIRKAKKKKRYFKHINPKVFRSSGRDNKKSWMM